MLHRAPRISYRSIAEQQGMVVLATPLGSDAFFDVFCPVLEHQGRCRRVPTVQNPRRPLQQGHRAHHCQQVRSTNSRHCHAQRRPPRIGPEATLPQSPGRRARCWQRLAFAILSVTNLRWVLLPARGAPLMALSCWDAWHGSSVTRRKSENSS